MKGVFLICMLFTFSLVLTGCPDLQKFAATVDNANATWVDASDELQAIGEEVVAALELYQAALASEDTDAIAKAKIVLEDAQARYQRQEEAVKVARSAVEDSIKQYEDAQKEGNYWWTVPGMVLGGVLGALGIRTRLGPALSAFSKTVANIKGALDESELDKVKSKQSETLTPAEKKAVTRALGK